VGWVAPAVAAAVAGGFTGCCAAGGFGGCGAVAGFGGCCAKAPDASDVATMNAVAANRIPVIGPPA